jgi:hypothetical protein
MKILTTTRYVAVQGLPMIYHIDDGAYELVNNSIRDLSNSRYIDMAGYLYDISGRETRIILPEMMNRFLTDERFVSMTNSVYEYDHIQYSVGTDDFVYNVSMKVIFFPKSKLVTDLSLNPIHKNVDKMIMFDHDDCYYIRRNGESITTSGMKFKLSSKAINIIGACGFLFVQKHDRSWTQYMINKTNETEGKFFESTKSLKIKKLKNITNVQSKLPCMYITTRKISNSEWLYKLYHKHDKITLEFEFKLNEEIKNFIMQCNYIAYVNSSGDIMVGRINDTTAESTKDTTDQKHQELKFVVSHINVHSTFDMRTKKYDRERKFQVV